MTDEHDREQTLGGGPQPPAEDRPYTGPTLDGAPTAGGLREGRGGGDWVGLELATGRYRVLRVLGQGGMGIVYLAEDRKFDNQAVIKRPHSHLLDDAASAARFAREVRTLIQLSHPHVCRIRDVDQQAGVPFVVMDYLAGGSLLDRQPRTPDGRPQPMPLDDVLGWLDPIAKALDFVHAQGHVHRDVKPGNILFDAHGNAYLTDFGIVKALSRPDRPQAQSLTVEGGFVGTPEYAAPEVFAGGPYDGRADQYSLAVVVYESLAGRRPFEGPTPFAISVKQATTAPIGLDEMNGSIPAALSDAVVKGLARSPQDRYPSCTEFVELLRRLTNAIVQRGRRAPPRTESRGGQMPECPTCKTRLQVGRAHAGKRISCPSCGARLRVTPDGRGIVPLEP